MARLPREVARYAAGVGIAGALAALLGLAQAGLPRPTPALGVLFVAGILASLAPLRFTTSGGVRGTTLDEAVFIAMLFVLEPGQVALALGGAAIVAHALSRNAVAKATFNFGAVGLSASAGAIAFSWIGTGPEVLSPRSVVATLTAVALFVVVTQSLVAELFRRLEGRPRKVTVAETWQLTLVTAMGNVSFGFVLAFVVQFDVRVAALAATIMAGLYLGYRGYAGVLEDRRRNDEMRDLSRSLVEMTSSPDALERFLEACRRIFGASGAGLLVIQHGEPQILTSGQGQGLEDVLHTSRRTQSAQRVEGARGTLVSPLMDRNAALGALAVTGRTGLEPWSDSDLHLLESLANEVVVSVRNIELFRDVTHERARLEEETSKLADIIGAASDGIMLIDREGRVAEWNTAMVDMTGLERDDALGRPWYLSLRVRDSQGEDLPVDGGTPLHRAIAGQAIDQLDLQIMRRDGAWRAVRASIASIERSDEHAGAVLVIRDVTYEREVQELRSDFIATVSHELRTPLTPLNGFLELLVARGTAMSVEQTEEIHRAMRTQVSRLSALVDDMLMMADLDKDQVELQSRAVDLRKVAERAVELEAKRADDADRITVVTAGDAVAMADPSAAVRVTRALISNALKHTDGPVRVTIDGHDERAMISVADQGSGIPTRDLDRIFERFGRLGDHLHRTQGPGLGLTIARTLAHELGGDVEVVSRIGHGSTFTFRLARARPRLVQDAKERRTG